MRKEVSIFVSRYNLCISGVLAYILDKVHDGAVEQ